MRQQRWLVSLVGVLVAAGLASPAAFAQDPIHKAGRGIGNVLGCWIEIPRNLHLGMQEENPLLGVGWGFVKGLGLGATRLVVGAYEAVTFPLPIPKDYVSPYEGMELSDYPWE
ncbi:MAG: exosortase system-associated protein, TIGR04073 family [Candidatus Omnitrophica bacterium]|nr:exosortase system-associated protein, TIGR04073 family [Candidatus Omnitrophota bacterium]